MSHLISIKKILAGIVLSILLFFASVYYKSAWIISTFNQEISEDLKYLNEQLTELTGTSELVSLKFKVSLKESTAPAQVKLDSFIGNFENVEAVVVYDGDTVLLTQTREKLKRLKFKKVIKRPEKIFNIAGRTYSVMRRDINGLFNNKLSEVAVYLDVDEYFTLLNLKNVDITGKPLKFDELGSFHFPSREHLFTITINDVIHTRTALIDGKPEYITSFYSWAYILIFSFFVYALMVTLLFINYRFKVLARIRQKMPWAAKEDEWDYGEYVSEEIFPIMNNMKVDLFDIKRTIKLNKSSKARPEDHLNIKELETSDEADHLDHEAQQRFMEQMRKEGKKTALINDPSVVKNMVYNFDYEDNIQGYNEEVFKVTEAKPKKEEKKHDFSENKTQMLETGKEKKIVYNEAKKDSFVSINVLDT